MHFASISDMIPWRFAYDRTNCARYLPWNLKITISLSTSYPQVNEYREKGGLSVQLGSVNKFGRIPMNQAIEETANREIKASGGTNCLLRRLYLAFNFIDSDSLRSACQISKSRQKIWGRVKQAQ